MESELERELDKTYGAGNWHCDDLYDHKTVPECVLAMLAVARAPAHGHGLDQPPLFATFEGKRVRVVMASRFGDVGITEDLNAEHGYTKRVLIPMLTDFSNVR